MSNPKKDPDYKMYMLYQACLKELDQQIKECDDDEYEALEDRRQRILTKSNKVMGRFLMRWQPIIMTEDELKREHQKVRNMIANAGMEFTLEEIQQGKHYRL
jgi:hypothetical protein